MTHSVIVLLWRRGFVWKYLSSFVVLLFLLQCFGWAQRIDTNDDGTSSSSSSTSTATTTTTTASSSVHPPTPLANRDTRGTVVTLPGLGKVQGRRDGPIDFFGGLPYAAPPVGNLRWAPPEPPAPWAPAKLDATHFGPDCWQVIDPLLNPSADTATMSEDCLYLNVFVPAGQAVPSRRPLPVLVWLHGGAFQQGGARRPEYDGRRLAERGTVVVTLNYRLGALGFMVSSTDGLFGNFGLMDQRAALHWVQDNIASFGGDPNNVMLFGESAGAVMAVLHLMMEPTLPDESQHQQQQQQQRQHASRGRTKHHASVPKRRLFHKAAIQSNPLGLQFRSVVVADFIGDALKASVDCRDLACLRAERVEEIMRAQSSLMGVPRSVGDFFTWGPTLTDSAWKVSIGGAGGSIAVSSTSSSSSASSVSQSTIVWPGRSRTSSSAFSPLSNREYQSMFRDLDSWKWQRQRRDASQDWAAVNVTQPLKDFGKIPHDIPVIIGANKHEGEMFVHGAFPIAMSKPVYWMFVGALFRDSAGRVLKHYRGHVDQIEAAAAELAGKQYHEEENRQYYLEHQEQLESEYKFLLEMNASNTANTNSGSGVPQSMQQKIETWARGGGSAWFGGGRNQKNTDTTANKEQESYLQENQKSTTNGVHNTPSFITVTEDGETRFQQTLSSDKGLFGRLWPFASNLTKEEREAVRIQQRNHERRLKEEKRHERAKARALREAAKVTVDYRPVMSRIIDDYLFRCPAWHLAQSLSRERVERGRNNNVYVYHFSHSTHIPGYKECWGKSCHTAEIPYVFQAMDIIRSNYSTLGIYAQKEAPASPEYPYTNIMNAYRGALKAAHRLGHKGNSNQGARSASNEESVFPNWGNEGFSLNHTKTFQKILGHFFGDYFAEDADEEIASDMADRWVAFAVTGEPNYDGSKAEWRPWRYQLDEAFGQRDKGRTWHPEDFDLIFDEENEAAVANETEYEYLWSQDPQLRIYRRRALAALGMEVVEEDVFRTMLKRSKRKEEVESFFESVFFGNNSPRKDSKRTRRAIRRLQQIAQDMGVLGRGLRGEPQRGSKTKAWEEEFFPEILELKWPPEGRLIERDCTCDFWDKIRYRY